MIPGVSWQPVVAGFAVFDLALAVGIVIASLSHRTPWQQRRSTRQLFEKDNDGVIKAPRRRALPAAPRLVKREVTRRLKNPTNRSRVVALVDAVHDAAALAMDGAARGPRCRAIRWLGEVPSSELLPRLLTLLSQADRREAIEALIAIGRNPVEYAGALVVLPPLVREGDPRVRLAATWACIRLLRACPEAISLIQEDASPAVRTAVVRAAALLSDDTNVVRAETHRALLHAVKDADPEVRRAASAACVRFATVPSFRRDLVEAFGDRPHDLPAVAVAAICAAPLLCDVRSLCATLSETPRKTAHAMLLAMSRLDQSIAAEATPVAFDHQSPLRTAAIRLLGTDQHPRAQEALAALLADTERTVRLEAAGAAAWSARSNYPRRLHRSLVERLIVTLEQDDSALLEHVIDALAHSGDPSVPAALIARIPVSSGRIRERVIEAGVLFAFLTRWAGRYREGAHA